MKPAQMPQNNLGLGRMLGSKSHSLVRPRSKHVADSLQGAFGWTVPEFHNITAREGGTRKRLDGITDHQVVRVLQLGIMDSGFDRKPSTLSPLSQSNLSEG